MALKPVIGLLVSSVIIQNGTFPLSWLSCLTDNVISTQSLNGMSVVFPVCTLTQSQSSGISVNEPPSNSG